MDRFGREIFGYKREDVNQLVKETIEKTEELLRKVEEQKQQIEILENQTIHYQEREKKLSVYLEESAGNPEQIKENAEIEAQRIVKEAQNNADRIISDALVRSEKLELKSITIERSIRKLKNQLRTIIEQQVDIIEQMEDLEKNSLYGNKK